MFDINEFNAALANGTDPDEIAKAFQDTLNAAIKNKKEADEAAKLKEMRVQQRAAKIARMDDIICEIAEFIYDFYNELYDGEVIDSIKTDEIVDAIDETVEQLNALKPLLKEVKVSNSADKAIFDFLKKYGL